MKSSSELTDYYYKILHTDLLELERDRKKLKSKVTTSLFGIAFITLILILSLYKFFNMAIVFVLFIALVLSVFTYKWMIKDYVIDFKFRIIAPLIKAVDDNLHYSATAHLSQRLFEHSGLFKQKIDRFSGNDLVKGMIDGTSLAFSDLHVEHESKNSKGQSHWETLFQGLFIVADFNKHFKASTLVLPDRAQKSFGDVIGGWLQSQNTTHGQLIKMDDPEFEKHFVVYGSDQVEARYLLTPSMMKRILDLKHRSKQELYLSFKSGQIYIAIAYNKDLFEPSLFGSLLDYKQAIEYIKTLHLAIGIVEELKLNQKLWSKQ
jgi:hypothetical protein